MPDITIHINTENITPDELEKLHRDIAHIKSLITDIVVRSLRVSQIPIDSVRQGLRASPRLIDSVEEGFRVLTSAEQVSGVGEAQRPRATHLLLSSVGEAQKPHTTLPIGISEAGRPHATLPIGIGEAQKPHTTHSLPHILDEVLRVSSIQQQTTALQQQTTILEQQRPVLETIEHLLLPQPNVPLREIQRQYIAPSVAEDTQHQPTRYLTDITRVQQALINTISDVPNDLLNATHEALIAIPAQTREALLQLKIETEQDIAEINDSAVLSAQEKAARIEQIERTAAERRKQIEAEANQAKIASFNKVVANFVRGIGRMIAEQVKLRIASQVLGAQQAIVPFFATHPVLSIGAAALFSSSFDDPINDALAQQAGIRQAQQRATALGRQSAIDLKQHFEMGFVKETERHTVSTQRTENPAPIVRNEVKLIIGGQELKAIYEETQRQIEMGVISV